MSDPRGVEIKQVVFGALDDGKQFIRFDACDEDGLCMFAWNLEDAFKWLRSNNIADDCVFIVGGEK